MAQCQGAVPGRQVRLAFQLTTFIDSTIQSYLTTTVHSGRSERDDTPSSWASMLADALRPGL